MGFLCPAQSPAVVKRPCLGWKTSGGSSGQRGVGSAQRVADASGSQDGAAHLRSPDLFSSIALAAGGCRKTGARSTSDPISECSHSGTEQAGNMQRTSVHKWEDNLRPFWDISSKLHFVGYKMERCTSVLFSIM